MRRLRAGLVTSRSGRFGLAVRSHYGGLQVDLLDAVWMKAGESLPDQGGRGSSVQARKSGSEAQNRCDDAPRGGCEKISQHHKDCPASVGVSSSLTSNKPGAMRCGDDDAWLFDI